MGTKRKFRSNLETIMESPSISNSPDVSEVNNNEMKCGKYYEDYTGRTSQEAHLRCGGEVDFRGASHLGCNGLVKNQSEETTESSSSFEDDVSDSESVSAFSDDEFVPFFGDDATFDGVGEIFRMRKRRLTDKWRELIQPVMWRCKWVELQIRQLNRLEHKYNRELAKYNQNELQQVDKVYKRKRRKRIENTKDIQAYMSNHNLFSYYDKPKDPADGISSYEDGGEIGSNSGHELGTDENLLFLKSREGDENWEPVFRQIYALKEHVRKLKIRLDQVMSNVPGKFSYADPKSSLVPCNALTSSARDPASNNSDLAVGSSLNASQRLLEFYTGDVALPRSEKSPGEFEDGKLIYDDKLYDGMNGFEDFIVPPPKRPRTAKEYQDTAAPPVFKGP